MNNNINNVGDINTLLDIRDQILSCSNFKDSEIMSLLKILTKKYNDCCSSLQNPIFIELNKMMLPEAGRNQADTNPWIYTPRCKYEGDD